MIDFSKRIHPDIDHLSYPNIESILIETENSGPCLQVRTDMRSNSILVIAGGCNK